MESQRSGHISFIEYTKSPKWRTNEPKPANFGVRKEIQMNNNIASLIGAQKVSTLCLLTVLILTACFTGCENLSTTKLLDAFTDPILKLNRTITVTLSEKNKSGISGTATFKEYVGSDTEDVGSSSIRNFDVEIQGAVVGRKYAAYIYSGNSCDIPGSIWENDGYTAYSFTVDDDGTANRSYTIDIDITDINGKVLIIHEQVDAVDLADGTQVSCGVITSEE